MSTALVTEDAVDVQQQHDVPCTRQRYGWDGSVVGTCGAPAAGIVLYTCDHGHTREKPNCADHIRSTQNVYCSPCLDSGCFDCRVVPLRVLPIRGRS